MRLTYKKINMTLKDLTDSDCCLLRVDDYIYLITEKFRINTGIRYLYDLNFEEWIERSLTLYFLYEKIIEKKVLTKAMK